MTEQFKPRLDILPKAQTCLWHELIDTPQEFTLYGGTAVALQLGHRESIDFDFFSRKKINTERLLDEVSYLKDARILQKEPNTLTVSVYRGDAIKISFFGVPKLPQLAAPHIMDDIGLKVAHLLDLAGTKVSVVQSRAEAKDYLDIDAILMSGQIDLLTALAAGKALYGSTFSPENALKALCYFEDGNVNSIPEETKKRLVKAATKVDIDRLPVIKPIPLDKSNKVKP